MRRTIREYMLYIQTWTPVFQFLIPVWELNDCLGRSTLIIAWWHGRKSSSSRIIIVEYQINETFKFSLIIQVLLIVNCLQSDISNMHEKTYPLMMCIYWQKSVNKTHTRGSTPKKSKVSPCTYAWPMWTGLSAR